jgi:hypothetical protein
METMNFRSCDFPSIFPFVSEFYFVIKKILESEETECNYITGIA